jgi:alpha-glucosidase
MLWLTRALAAVRKGSEALKTGEARIMETPKTVLGFERRTPSERVFCLFELGGEAVVIASPGSARDLLISDGVAMDEAQLRLPPYGFAILRPD